MAWRSPVIAAVVVVSVCGFSARANEKPSDEYRKAMQDLQAASEIVRHHARMVEPGGDCCYDWVEKDAAVLKAAFGTTLAFWTARGVKNAVRIARDATSDAAELERAAKTKHYDGVVAALGAVLASCEPCHLAYREQLPDGTFEIR
jgi:cytochrome c556